MYQIAICDDDDGFIEYMKEMILQGGIRKEDVTFHQYNSGEALLADCSEQKEWDLLILDMHFTKMDGQETAVEFRKLFPTVLLVFCSGVYQPTDESFKVTPFRYLLKSYTEEHMQEEIGAVLKEMETKKKEPYIIGTYYYHIVKLKPEDILFFENWKHGSRIHVRENCVDQELADKITTKKKLQELSLELKSCGFESAHNRYLVNLNYVSQFLPEGKIRLADNTVLPVSRSCLKEFRRALVKKLSSQY